jgi:hypothetical protein
MARIQPLCLALGLSLACPGPALAAWSPNGNAVGQFDRYVQRISTHRGRMFSPEANARCAHPLAQIAPAMAPGNVDEALVV